MNVFFGVDYTNALWFCDPAVIKTLTHVGNTCVCLPDQCIHCSAYGWRGWEVKAVSCVYSQDSGARFVSDR
jgi:hypothetical protein